VVRLGDVYCRVRDGKALEIGEVDLASRAGDRQSVLADPVPDQLVGQHDARMEALVPGDRAERFGVRCLDPDRDQTDRVDLAAERHTYLDRSLVLGADQTVVDHPGLASASGALGSQVCADLPGAAHDDRLQGRLVGLAPLRLMAEWVPPRP
jgi:hypothetical protein